MKKMIKECIPAELYQSVVLLYGAGTTGKRVIKLLEPYPIDIKYIIDDDISRQGSKIENIEIISQKRLEEIAESSGRVSVILATIYGKTVLNRLRKFPDIEIYEMYDWLDEAYGADNLAKRVKKEEIECFGQQINLLKTKLADEESGRVLQGIYDYMCFRDPDIIDAICTASDQYFIPEVLKAVKEPLQLIDGGAYVGELYQVIKDHNLELKNWYCFEADEENYNKLLQQSEKMGLSGIQECMKKGLWDKEGVLYFDGEKDALSKIVDYQTDDQIETISIDAYFKDRRCNFIKMDIEGAEYPALCGARETIKRDRPILTISIYHSLEDYYRIPDYLMRELCGYKYYIRHHALILSETVLYAIPEELIDG